MPVVAIDVPSLGNRTHLVHDHRVAVAVDPPRDLAAGRARGRGGRRRPGGGGRHPRPQRLRLRRPGAGPPPRRRLPAVRGRAGRLRAGRRARRRRPAVRRPRARGARARRATPATTSRTSRACRASPVRCSAAAACCSAPSAAPTWSTRGWPSTWPARSGTAPAPSSPWRRTPCCCPPTGSAASARPPAVETDGDATIGAQHDHPATQQDRDAFAAELVAGFGPVPAYYPHMDPLNRSGPGTARPARPASAAEVAAAVAAGRWVVDLRDRARHAEAHLAGTVGMEYSDQFATYVGWLVPWGTDLLLLTDDPADLGPAVRDLARIGIEDVGVHVLAAGSRLEASYRRTDWATYAADEGPEGRRRRPPARRVRRGPPARRRPRAGAGRRDRPAASRRALGALQVRLPRRHRRQPPAPSRPRRGAPRRPVGARRRAGDPHDAGRLGAARPTRGAPPAPTPTDGPQHHSSSAAHGGRISGR